LSGACSSASVRRVLALPLSGGWCTCAHCGALLFKLPLPGGWLHSSQCTGTQRAGAQCARRAAHPHPVRRHAAQRVAQARHCCSLLFVCCLARCTPACCVLARTTACCCANEAKLLPLRAVGGGVSGEQTGDFALLPAARLWLLRFPVPLHEVLSLVVLACIGAAAGRSSGSPCCFRSHAML